MATAKKTVRKTAKKVSKGEPKIVSASPAQIVSARPLNIRHRSRRSRPRPLGGVWSLLIWFVGLLVSLAVGFGMVDGTLKIPYISEVVTMAAGWIVVAFMLLGVLFKLIDSLSR